MWKKVNDCLFEERGKSSYNLLINILIVLVAAVLVFEIFFGITYSGIYVVQSSMYPTLTGAKSENQPGGDYVYVNRHKKPDYGDIVVITRKDNTTLIKRVVAFGGDYVMLKAGKLYVKYSGDAEFTEIDEPYVAPENNTPDYRVNNFYWENGGYFVKEGYFFLIGDNRDYSNDSRQNGAYPVSNLYGVVTDWSMRNKKFNTAVHTYFSYDLPACFGIKKR